MAVTSPVGKIAQVNPGQYVDEANNFWTGTKEAPVYGGPWNGPKPTSFVDVYGASPSAPVPPPTTATPPPPAAAPPPTSGGTPPPILPSTPGPGIVSTQPVPGNPRSGDPTAVPPPATGGQAAPTGAYLQSLINSGMSPQEAVAQFNRETGRTTGNEAVYYGAEVHGKPTIGLPGEYLSQEGNGWQVSQRVAEGPTTQAAPTSYNYQTFLGKVQQALGRTLSPAEIAKAFQELGGNTSTMYTDASLPAVLDYFKKQGPSALEPRPVDLAPAGPGGPLATGTTGPSSNVNSPYGDQGIMDQFRAAIAKRLQEIGSPVDENSANIAAPLTAARNEASRVSDQERNALAERLYAQGGLNTDAVTRGIQQSSERNAVGLGGLRAQLITREYDARRSDLNAMLAQATASGDNASARAIQQKLAELDAAIRREGIGADLAKYSAYLNQNAALNGLNG